MKIIKCKKCGSTHMTLKYVQEEEQKAGFFDYFMFWILGIFTLGLYFVFYHFAEKKRRDLGFEYYVCEDCHCKIGTRYAVIEENEEPKEELDEEEKKEILEIGKNPVNLETWKEDRAKKVHEKLEKRKNMQKDE